MKDRSSIHPYSDYFDKIPSGELSPKPCTGRRSVVIVYNPMRTSILLEERSKWPKHCWSIVSEHIEIGETAEEEARKGLLEETTLKLANIRRLLRVNSVPVMTFDTCRRRAKKHETIIFECTSNTELVQPNNDEVKKLRWVPLAELQSLAEVTWDFYEGMLSKDEYKTNPGLLPATIQVLQHRGFVK